MLTPTKSFPQVTAGSGSVQVTWSDGHVSEFSADWLQKRRFCQQVQKERQQWLQPRKARLWDGKMADHIVQIDFEEASAGSSGGQSEFGKSK